MPHPSNDLKTYTPAEEKANMLTHLLGLAIVFCGMYPLLSVAARQGSAMLTGAIIYELCLLAMFGASTLYHHVKDPEKKRFCRRLDHAAIYLLIAGTYTPILLVAVGGTPGYWLLGFIWLIALIGITLKCFFVQRFHKLAVVLYLAMGWFALAIIRQIIAGMTQTSLILLIAGGVTYTAGVLFYASRAQYSHAVWHLFVLAGSILHFYAVMFMK